MASTLIGSPKEKWIRSFTVTDPIKHEKGFTVYKVTYRGFCLNKPDDVIEVTVWKRYNDFKKLHKLLSTLHTHLRRPEQFPEFAKAKFFGRFDDQVIEERRKSALRLLEFAATISPLCRNTYFTKFFEGGEEITKTLPSERAPILQPKIITPIVSSDLTQATTQERGVESKDDDKSSSGIRNGLTPPLGGIWLHRQAEDEVVDYGDLGQLEVEEDDDDDDRTTFSEDSVPSTPLPQLQDMSIFDPCAGDVPISEGGTIPHSNSWLFHAMDMCAELNQDGSAESTQEGNSVTDQSTDSGITINFSPATTIQTPSDLSISDSATLSPAESNVATPSVLPSPDIDTQDVPGSKPQRSSMARAYLNSIRAQQAASADSVHRGVVDSRAGPSTPERKSSSSCTSSGYSAADLKIGGVEDYLYQAARHISMALDNEANGNYQPAFDLYKEGVGILLKGVIGDNNKTRREAVRRKTAQYLMKAEDLYNKYLSTAAANARRWELQKKIVEFDPSSAHLKGLTDDLKNYKVLGIVDRIMLVLDMASYQTYAIKVLRKYPVANKNRKTIIPADCPYMVKLYRYFETDCSIFLILEHATGGKLWTYASAYLHHHDLNNMVPFVCSLEGRSVGSRSSRRSRASSSISVMEERVRRISGGEDSVFDDESPRKQMTKPSSRIESVHEDEQSIGTVQPDGETVTPGDESATSDYNKQIDSVNEFGTLEMESTSTPCKQIEHSRADASTPHGLSESPEVASSYANLFSDYTTKKSKNNDVDDSDDFMHIDDIEESGSNLNDLVQASSQYDDNADISKDSHGLGIAADQSRSDGTFSDGYSSQDKSFNSTVHQVNTKPPPLSLFSIGSSDSPDVHSSESVDQSQFRFTPDYKDVHHGSHEGLGKLPEETDNGATNQNDKIWQDHDPESVMTDAMKVLQELEGEEDTIFSKPAHTHAAENNRIIIPDTSGFGAVLEEGQVSAPGVDLAEFFDQSKSGDRQRTMSSPSQTNNYFSNSSYGNSHRTGSIGNDKLSAETTSPFLGLKSSSSLSFGHKDSLDSSEPKSSLEDLLEPSDTSEITSEWEIGAKLTIDESDFSPNRTDYGASNPDINEALAKDKISNCANDLNGDESVNPPVIKPTLSAGQVSNGTDIHTTDNLIESGVVSSDNGSLESSTTAKELPSSVYSSTQSTPKHPSAAVISSKMADWPGDVQTHVSAELGIPGNIPSALETPPVNKSTLPKTRLPSLSTFLAQMDEATAKHATQTTLPESCVKMWAAEIVVAISSLHMAGIICKDLRPHNILLAEGGHIRLSYFSQWKCVEPELDNYACEHFYTAPEVTGVYDVTNACDWWSLGAILYELLTSKSLHSCHPSGINSHTELNIPDHVSPEAKGILQQVNPSERLGNGRTGIDDIRVHPFFHGINWNLYKG